MERKSIQHSKVEVAEDVFDNLSNFSGSNHVEYGYEDSGSVSYRPSTNRNTTGKINYVYQEEQEIPEANSNDDNSSPER